MVVVGWFLVSVGLATGLTGKWIAFWGRVPLEDDRDTLTAGMRLVGPFLTRWGLIAASVGGVLLLGSLAFS